jgi:hypothetical protein
MFKNVFSSLCVCLSAAAIVVGCSSTPTPQPAAPGSYGYLSEEHINPPGNLQHVAAVGWTTGFNQDGWSGRFQKVDGKYNDFLNHPYTDVFLVYSHGNQGEVLFTDNFWDIQATSRLTNERWLYFLGCNVLQELGVIGPNPEPWYNAFGARLHGVYGYEIELYDDPSFQQLTQDIATHSWRQGSTNPPSAYDGWAAANANAMLLGWAVVDGVNSHNDALSAAPNQHVVNGDDLASIGSLYEHWNAFPNIGPTSVPIPTAPPGTAAATMGLQPESVDANYWINKYADGTQSVYQGPGVTLVTKPGAAAMFYKYSGGIQFITGTSDLAAGFDMPTAQQAALRFVIDNGGIPNDAVLRSVATAMRKRVGSAEPPTITGYTFYFTHAAPIVGYDGITVSIDEQGYDKCVAGHWEIIRNPDPPFDPHRVWVCDEYQFISVPAVNYYRRLWRQLVPLPHPIMQPFVATLNAAQILPHVYHSSALTRTGFGWWTPPMNWNTPAQQLAPPAQFYEVDGNLRVDYDLSGNFLGEGGIL